MSGALSSTEGCLDTVSDRIEDLPIEEGLVLGAGRAVPSSLLMKRTLAFVVRGLLLEMSLSMSCNMLPKSLPAGSLGIGTRSRLPSPDSLPRARVYRSYGEPPSPASTDCLGVSSSLVNSRIVELFCGWRVGVCPS